MRGLFRLLSIGCAVAALALSAMMVRLDSEVAPLSTTLQDRPNQGTAAEYIGFMGAIMLVAGSGMLFYKRGWGHVPLTKREHGYLENR